MLGFRLTGQRPLWKKQKITRRAYAFGQAGNSSGGSPNGFLLLGVVASILIMVGLGSVNMTFLGDPPACQRSRMAAGDEPSCSGMPWSRVPACSGPGSKDRSQPAAMTFYRRLTTLEQRSDPKPEHHVEPPSPGVLPGSVGNPTVPRDKPGTPLPSSSVRKSVKVGEADIMPRTEVSRTGEGPPRPAPGEISSRSHREKPTRQRTEPSKPAGNEKKVPAEGKSVPGPSRKGNCPQPEPSGSTATQPGPKPALRIEKTPGPRAKYTVQVGAYEGPTMATQAAERWRKKGYKAILKPVARSDGAILYRLQLGGVDSPQEADELIQRLNKEGITAIRRRIGKAPVSDSSDRAQQ